MKFRCSWCGSVKKKATIWWNERTGEILFLCFHGCQNFPEPFRDTEAGEGTSKTQAGWHRIDPWQDYKREYPRLKKSAAFRISSSPTRQVKINER